MLLRRPLLLKACFEMDPTTASYYRAILFNDSQDQRPLPPALMKLHQWAARRNQVLGLGGTVSKAVALSIAMTWMSSTREGREFTQEYTPLGDLFSVNEDSAETSLSAEEWDTLPAESDVVVTLNDKKTRVVGKYLGRRGSYLDIRIEGEVRAFKTSQVKLSGV